VRSKLTTWTSVLVGLSGGITGGLGGYTFLYARGASYLTNDPRACVNCHVMRDQYNAWTRSSHHAVAVCNDCHTPHARGAKYWVKASNGWHHSMAFTTGKFHEPIQIGPRNRKVTEQACRHCHEAVVQAIDSVHPPGEGLACLRCHPHVGHLH